MVASDSEGLKELIKTNETLLEINRRLVEDNLKLKEMIKRHQKCIMETIFGPMDTEYLNGIIIKLVPTKIMITRMKLPERIPWMVQKGIRSGPKLVTNIYMVGF